MTKLLSCAWFAGVIAVSLTGTSFAQESFKVQGVKFNTSITIGEVGVAAEFGDIETQLQPLQIKPPNATELEEYETEVALRATASMVCTIDRKGEVLITFTLADTVQRKIDGFTINKDAFSDPQAVVASIKEELGDDFQALVDSLEEEARSNVQALKTRYLQTTLFSDKIHLKFNDAKADLSLQ